MAKTTVVAKCTCSDSDQDKLYGKNYRVMNPIGKGSANKGVNSHRCTVCKKEHSVR